MYDEDNSRMIDTTEMENVMKVDNRLKLILGLDRPNSVGDISLEQYILNPIPVLLYFQKLRIC